jgi:hypothetical protein
LSATRDLRDHDRRVDVDLRALLPLLRALGLSVLFLPSTVTVTVCVPAAMASPAQTTRRGWTVAA